MLDRTELETVAKLIDQLSLYQILKVSPLSSKEEIQEAFHREALEFHPDQYFSEEDPELHKLSKKVYAKIVEAYQTLSNREKRLAYDKKDSTSSVQSHVSLEDLEDEDIDEDAITSIQRRPSWTQKAPGDKFFELAQKAFNNRDYHTARMNIQIALGTDAKNSRYVQLKERVDLEIEKIKQKNS